MNVSAVFGVKSEDIEEACARLKQILKLPAEPRESSDSGGDYYKFEGPTGEIVDLLQNADLYDGETLRDGTDGWKLILTFYSETSDSALLRVLENAPEILGKLAEETFE